MPVRDTDVILMLITHDWNLILLKLFKHYTFSISAPSNAGKNAFSNAYCMKTLSQSAVKLVAINSYLFFFIINSNLTLSEDFYTNTVL